MKQSLQAINQQEEKDILKTMSKTNGDVSNDEMFIDTYLPFADKPTKLLVKGLLEIIRKQNGLIEKQLNEIFQKEDIIISLMKSIDLAKKRQLITQIIKNGHKDFQQRYNLLYDEFEKKYHIDITRRLNNAKECGEVSQYMTKMDYICEVMNMTRNLYELCCKIFENDFK